MRILAIDPGFERMGVAVVEYTQKERSSSLRYSSCFKTSAKKDFPVRLRALGDEIERIILEWKPDALAIETLLFNSNQKTAMRVAEARGVIIYKATVGNLPVYEYTPLQVKIAITSYGRAPKEQVDKMVRKLIHVEKTLINDDEMDAIAIGLTCLANISTRYPQG